MTDTVPAAATGLSIHPILRQSDTRRRRLRRSTFDAAEHARAMNAMLADLNALLEGGAHA